MSFKPKFKQPTEDSYQIFREVIQIIDACYLDVETYQYKPRAIVSATLFLVLGKHFSEFTFGQICENFQNTFWMHQYFNQTEDQCPYLYLMTNFIYLAFGFLIEQIVPTIQYVSTYFAIPFMYNLPSNIKS